MKPAVINNNSETPTQTHHEPNSQQANNGQSNNDHTRRFPQFRQHGFGFDDPDGDVFADMGLRSRLNRMGNPFSDWSARKRHGGAGQGNADGYDHYFDDVDFPNFGSTWDAFGRMGGKRHPAEAPDRSGFFNYVPQEFRQYVPEHFGGYFRQHGGQSPYMQQQQPQPQQQPPLQQPAHQQRPVSPALAHQQHQPQHHQTQPQCSQPTKSNLCDAAIQTDDDSGPIQNPSPVNSTERDNRNGMMQGNECNNQNNQFYQQPCPNPNYASAPPYGRPYPQPYAQQYSQAQAQPQPQNRHPAAAATSSSSSSSNQPHPKQPSHEGYVRNVPIVFETTGTPINRNAADAASGSGVASSSPPSQQKPRPEPLNKDSFASNQPIPCPPPPAHNQHAQQQQQQHPDQQQHSEPSNADVTAAPPQTPHTADCISKIQAIQRDVLELMLAVEQFGGKRGDRDYIYLDEMLTRNLLKLDTIDTNGKDSIRMARKEAIKCIQTSIAVLEAKADLHLNENKGDSVDQSTENRSGESGDGTSVAVDINAAAVTEPNQQKSAEKIDIVESNASLLQTNGKANANSAEGEQPNDACAAMEIPKVENICINDKPSNDTENETTGNSSKDKSKKIKEKTPEIVDAKK